VATQQELHEPPEGCMLLNMMPESMMAIRCVLIFLARPTTRQDYLNFYQSNAERNLTRHAWKAFLERPLGHESSVISDMSAHIYIYIYMAAYITAL
jgi:hypothetical protein